jgi:aspartate carbamoyltransferase regulatory subunit
MKIQEEEVLTLLSGSENNSISNIKLTIPMNTALIFKEQAKVKELGLRENGLAQPALAQPHYSIQHIEGYDLLCYKEKIYIPQSLRKINIEYCPGSMNIYFIWDRLEQKRLSGIP